MIYERGESMIYYRHKKGIIFCENCLDTMSRMKDNYIDLVVTSPPYDNLRNYKGYSFDFESTAKELYRIIKKGGIVVWVVGDATVKGSETGTSFKQALYFKEIGFNLHDTMIYAKNNPVPLTHNRYEQQFEFMFILAKGKPKVFNPIKIATKTNQTYRYRGRSKNYESSYSVRAREEYTRTKPDKIDYNIWFYSVGTNDKTKHNAPFPEQLANDHIISWSNESDLVYDPFLGSGTAAKMALINNRYFIGSEISEEYCEIAKNRIIKLEENL